MTVRNSSASARRSLEGGKAANGFVALAQYDQPLLGGNDDGVISRADAIWPELTMWLDVQC